MKTEVLSLKEFLHGKEKQPILTKIENHFKKYGKVYKIAGISLIILSTGTSAFAMIENPYAVPASTAGIGPAAKQLYMQLVGVGKWIIIFKGGFDTIKSIGNGDFEGAKKNFFAYLLTYLFLLALPYGMDQVDKIVESATLNQ